MAFGNRLIDIGGAALEPTLGDLTGYTAMGGKYFPPSIFPNSQKTFSMSVDGSKFLMIMENNLYEMEASGTPLSVSDSPTRTNSNLYNYNLLKTGLMTNEDGTIIQVATYNNPNRTIKRWLFSSPFNISTANSQTQTNFLPEPSESATGVSPYAVGLSRDGTIMTTYAYTIGGSYVKQLDVYQVNDPHNAPAGFSLLYSVPDFTQDTKTNNSSPARAIKFNNNGLLMYILGDTSTSGLSQYNLTTPYDPSTAVYSGITISFDNNNSDFNFAADYSWVAIGGKSSTIYSWNLVTP